jgi:DNA-binding response OmpR family regulator
MSTKSRILVVDDSEAKRYELARTLTAAGYDVVEADSGSDALTALDGVSLVVLDVHLPDMHGFEVCRAVRKALPTVPIIHVSSVYVDPPYQTAGRWAGANAYLVQPFERQELLDKVAELLGKRDA